MADFKNTLKIPRGILDEFLECPKSFISVGVFLANCQCVCVCNELYSRKLSPSSSWVALKCSKGIKVDLWNKTEEDISYWLQSFDQS